MSFLREMGLAAALLAATGGAAVATWNYFSAKRRKEPGQECTPEDEGAAELEQEKTHEAPTEPHSSPDPTTLHGGHRDVSEEGGHATGPCALSAPLHTERADTVQEDNTPLTGASAVHVEAERAHGACIVQGDRSQPERSIQADGRSQPACIVQDDRSTQHERSVVQVESERSDSTYTVQDDKTSQPERSETTYTLQDDSSQPERSAMQMETERAHSACIVKGERSQRERAVHDDRSQQERAVHDDGSQPERSVHDDGSQPERAVHDRSQSAAMQVETERAHSACIVQDDRSAQHERSAVQVESERSDSTYIVQDDRSQPERSETTYTVQDDKRSETSAVQVESERAHIMHSDRSQTAAVQVESEITHSAYTVLENRSAELVTPPVEPPVTKELSDSDICTEIQEVKASLSKQVVVLGLDGSGKTSVLNSLAANKGKIVTTPTAGVNAMCVSNGSSKMEFLEIGGSEHLRPYWKMYLSRAFAVIFVVDSADHSRLPLAKRHLHQLIQQDAIIPLIVLANKQDLKNAYHITEIHEALGLADICENRKLFLIGTYATNGESEVSSGILDAKEFLAQLLSESSAEIS